MQETQETQVQFLDWEDPLEEGMATHFSILAWRIPRTAWWATVHRVQRVRHNWSDLAAVAPALVLFWAPQVIQWLRIHLQCRRCRRHRFDPWVGKIPWRRKWQPTPVFLPGKFPGQRSLVGYSSWGHTEPDTTEQLNTTHVCLTCILPASCFFFSGRVNCPMIKMW